MSDWDVDKLSLDAWVTDLKTVVDVIGVERFPLLGISQGGAVAVAYSLRHPERVSHLILYGAFALGGKKRSPAEKEMRDAMTTLMRLGWGADNPSFRQMFTGRFIPGGTHEQADYFNELQLKTTSPRVRCTIFRCRRRFRYHRSSAESEDANACHACAGRPSGSLRGGTPVGRQHPWRPFHRPPRPKPFVPGARAGFPPILRGDQAFSEALIGASPQALRSGV
jgi:pimeloyl-ACP methyl ester carboxylesterase